MTAVVDLASRKQSTEPGRLAPAAAEKLQAAESLAELEGGIAGRSGDG